MELLGIVMVVAGIAIGWRLWSARGAGSRQPGPGGTATEPPPCCAAPSLVTELDLGSAGGFEFDLAKCASCGTYRMKVFCVASGISGIEAVSAGDVQRMKSLAGGPDLKAYMREWGDRNL
jgi:hypothetical protein